MDTKMGEDIAVTGDEAPKGYRIVFRATENTHQQLPIHAVSFPSEGVVVPAVPGTEITKKKKRGRPRKNDPDTIQTATAAALFPMPISSSMNLTRGLSGWKQQPAEPQGDNSAYFLGENFTPHVITVNAGEDIMMKIMSFCQQGSHGVCTLSANGSVSNVTLRHSTSSGGTLTYEGLFEILSLSGSYLPVENGGTKSISGRMSISLAGQDGRVIGGGLTGLLIAARPVQVVVGSFIAGCQQEQKDKKQMTEATVAVPPVRKTVISTISADELKAFYGGNHDETKSTGTPFVFFHGNGNKATAPRTSSFHGDGVVSLNQLFKGSTNPATGNNISSLDDNSEATDDSN